MVLTAPGIPMLFQGQEFLEDGWRCSANRIALRRYVWRGPFRLTLEYGGGLWRGSIWEGDTIIQSYDAASKGAVECHFEGFKKGLLPFTIRDFGR